MLNLLPNLVDSLWTPVWRFIENLRLCNDIFALDLCLFVCLLASLFCSLGIWLGAGRARIYIYLFIGWELHLEEDSAEVGIAEESSRLPGDDPLRGRRKYDAEISLRGLFLPAVPHQPPAVRQKQKQKACVVLFSHVLLLSIRKPPPTETRAGKTFNLNSRLRATPQRCGRFGPSMAETTMDNKSNRVHKSRLSSTISVSSTVPRTDIWLNSSLTSHHPEYFVAHFHQGSAGRDIQEWGWAP